MESLESKLDRLSPEQRKETEDFVDFLLSRSGQVCIPPDISLDLPLVLRVAPPPLTIIKPAQGGETRPPVQHQGRARSLERVPPAGGDKAVSSSFHEIGGGLQDWISHDYMDYGEFEKQSSPAIEAVRKVKAKLGKSGDREKSRHLLDWVD
jgi:hypothetical protein